MERKRQQQCTDEPAVTFELDEAPKERSRSRFGAVGTAAITGAGLISGGATPQLGDSLDVFDQAEAPDADAGDIPSTSFEDLGTFDPEFPPIDFEEPSDEPSEGADAMFGASSDVGGGFALDDVTEDETFGAAEADVAAEPVPDSLVEDGAREDDVDVSADAMDDLDLT